jgi:hypothetical protein
LQVKSLQKSKDFFQRIEKPNGKSFNKWVLLPVGDFLLGCGSSVLGILFFNPLAAFIRWLFKNGRAYDGVHCKFTRNPQTEIGMVLPKIVLPYSSEHSNHLQNLAQIRHHFIRLHAHQADDH